MNWLANQPTEAFTASKSECANHVELEAVAHVSRALCSVRFRRRRVSCLFWGTAQLQKRAGRSFDRAQKLPSLEAFVSSHLDLRDTSSVVSINTCSSKTRTSQPEGYRAVQAGLQSSSGESAGVERLSYSDRHACHAHIRTVNRRAGVMGEDHNVEKGEAVCWPKANPELQYRLESRRERTSGLERLCNSSGFSWN